MAADWAAPAEMPVNAMPADPWGSALFIFFATTIFLLVFTRLIIRLAANTLRLATRLLPIRRLAAIVLLLLFLLGSVLQLLGT